MCLRNQQQYEANSHKQRQHDADNRLYLQLYQQPIVDERGDDQPERDKTEGQTIFNLTEAEHALKTLDEAVIKENMAAWTNELTKAGTTNGREANNCQ